MPMHRLRKPRSSSSSGNITATIRQHWKYGILLLLTAPCALQLYKFIKPKKYLYTGHLWSAPDTISRQLLAETPFARCDQHSVRLENNKVVHDWIFMEERDAVNVAVVFNHQFLVFEQTKYAIPGTTLAPVGGYINNKETPFDAARREVYEELGVGSTVTQQNMNDSNPFVSVEVRVDEFGLAVGDTTDTEPDWVFLGKYRTMANRGGGFVYSYLLKNAVSIAEQGGTAQYAKFGDDEAQSLRTLSLDETREAVVQGKFQEVKWAATLSLALLHLQE